MVQNSLNVHEMVDLIAETIKGDIRIDIDKRTMTDALDSDLGKNGIRPLSKEDIEFLVMGNDEGDVPQDLQKLYPKTHETIAFYYE